MTISSETLDYTWGLLETAPHSTGNLVVREYHVPEFPEKGLLFALDSDQCRHLLIPIESREEGGQDRRSAGVQISTHSLMDSGELRHFIDIVCRIPRLNALFSLVVKEIISNLSVDPANAFACSTAVLGNWRRLFASTKPGLPSPQLMAGVFGELLVLERLAENEPRALATWVGPRRARHDFRSRRGSIEVKSTLSRSSWMFEIHGHDQLEPEGALPLFLIANRLEESHLGRSIPELIHDIEGQGVDGLELATKLSEVGIGYETFDQISETKYQLVDQRSYAVDDQFPRLTGAELKYGSLPQGVVKIEYVIDLSMTEHLMLGSDEVEDIFLEVPCV